MTASLGGRPSKGRRPHSRASASIDSARIIDKLQVHHRRANVADVVSAAIIVGLRHPELLESASLRWASCQAPDPGYLEDLRDNDTDEQPGKYYLRMPQLHHDAVEDLVTTYYSGPDTGMRIRSALLWAGLHHPREIPAALAELDQFQHRTASGVTLGDLYLNIIENRTSRAPLNARATLEAVRQLRDGIDVADVAADTGLPRRLLTALSVEAISAVEGSLQLTG
ncbi:hypothetical protein ACFQNE_02700 [Gordonia phosphorivorans]|uniref:Uncharacterized protein n=1 Tax=Gordonia phosphorivorans TaxID=1056982 RepID=A0ABV6H508_9ACTN